MQGAALPQAAVEQRARPRPHKSKAVARRATAHVLELARGDA